MSSSARDVREALAAQLSERVAQVLVLSRMPAGQLKRSPALVLRRASTDRRIVMGGPLCPTFDVVAVVSLASDARSGDIDDLVDEAIAAVEADLSLGLPDVECFVEQVGDEERVEIAGQAFIGVPVRVPCLVAVS